MSIFVERTGNGKGRLCFLGPLYTFPPNIPFKLRYYVIGQLNFFVSKQAEDIVTGTGKQQVQGLHHGRFSHVRNRKE